MIEDDFMFKEFDSHYDCNYYSYAEKYVSKVLSAFLKKHTNWLKYDNDRDSILKAFYEDNKIDVKIEGVKERLFLNGCWCAGTKYDVQFENMCLSGDRYPYSEEKAGIIRTCRFKHEGEMDYELICKINNCLTMHDRLPRISTYNANTIEITEYFDCGWIIEKYGTHKEFNNSIENYTLNEFENAYEEYPLTEKEELLIAREICSIHIVNVISGIISNESHKKRDRNYIMETICESGI